MTDSETLEAGKRKENAIFKPNFPVIFYSTAIVVLVGSIMIPLWFKYDPIVGILSQLLQPQTSQDVLMSKQQLSHYGSKVSNEKIYLAILGKVFDVTIGKQHYGNNGAYSFFTGIHNYNLLGNREKHFWTPDVFKVVS